MSKPHLFVSGQCARCGASLRATLAPVHLRDECSLPDADVASSFHAMTVEQVTDMHEQTEAKICEELHALRSDIAACRLARAEVEARLGLLADSLWQTRKGSRVRRAKERPL